MPLIKQTNNTIPSKTTFRNLFLVTMQSHCLNVIPVSMILQKRITASQVRVKMEAVAIISQVDTHAAARMITLGTTAIVGLIATMYI